MPHAILSIDQGTTSTRAMLFDRAGKVLARAQTELPQHYPADGWVEHDALRIWQDTLAVVRDALAGAGLAATEIAAIGVTNQRETTVVWDRQTGQPIHPAIVWQDRRTAAWCAAHHTPEREQWLADKTGLLLDPYFSASKIAWLLDHVAGARQRAEAGELAFGTIDSWLIWQLTGGAVHATDATNACRTLLFNLHTQDWDPELLAFFGVPASLLPQVQDCAADYGSSLPELFGAAIPIRGVAGDQQAATVGQACFAPGMVKSTYGTGCFMVMNTGSEMVRSRNRLITTLAYRLDGQPTFALEGSIFIAGAAVQWLRDAVKLIGSAAESEKWAREVDDTHGVYLVPAFTGLGAPYWDPQARGAIIGLTRDSGIAVIVRAALESVCYQTRDLLEAMRADGTTLPAALRVDGGMAGNNWVMQFLADLLDTPVERPTITETTALGAAYLAGLGIGLYANLEEISQLWACQQHFSPAMAAERRVSLYDGWVEAVSRVRSK
ncbi:glycerol kinase 1 [Chitinimonas prasina]|uniref:Glycerol kinase n=1 Tax=Chitinimonas prasina TaxID=1434937 RepID=A0ABQ5YCG0_9NEIS|nr:glycerol kinase GlpK [Chitinimonas prasina]GLR12632.1 glycerol kinase 1 [Chitinimonas prasina]